MHNWNLKSQQRLSWAEICGVLCVFLNLRRGKKSEKILKNADAVIPKCCTLCGDILFSRKFEPLNVYIGHLCLPLFFTQYFFENPGIDFFLQDFTEYSVIEDGCTFRIQISPPIMEFSR